MNWIDVIRAEGSVNGAAVRIIARREQFVLDRDQINEQSPALHRCGVLIEAI